MCVRRVYEGVALEHVFYLLSHGCHCDGRVGAAVAHGNRISLCIPGSDVEAPWGVGGVGMGGERGAGGVATCTSFPHTWAPEWLLAEPNAELYKPGD